MPCLYCRKMCCLNGSRKLHFVQKIRLDHIIKYLGPEVFFAHLRNFLQVLDLLIFLLYNKRLQELLQALDAERTRFELVEP